MSTKMIMTVNEMQDRAAWLKMRTQGIGTVTLLIQFFGVMIGAIDHRP